MKQFAKQFFDKNIELTLRKNADYSGIRGIWSTFEAVADYGINPIDGFITRMSDKIQRIETLLVDGAKTKVKSESITDTLADLANYCMLLTGFIRHEKDLAKFAESFYKEVMEYPPELFESHKPLNTIREQLRNVAISNAKNYKHSLIKIAYYSCLIAYDQDNSVNRTQPRRDQMEKPRNNMG